MKDAAIVVLLLLVGGALAIIFVYVGPDVKSSDIVLKSATSGVL